MTEPGQRDLRAEEMHREWHGWMTAQGYDFDDDSYQAEAFAAGMQAERDLAAQHPGTGITVETLTVALRGRRFLVTAVQSAPGDSLWLATPAMPHPLAVQLLTAIDARLTDDARPATETSTERNDQ